MIREYCLENKRVVWVNPSFLDYRVPLYEALNNKLQRNFRLIFSKQRVPKRCVEKVKDAIGENAMYLNAERCIKIGKNNGFSNNGINIPFPKGLYKLIRTTKPDIIIAEGFFQFTPWAVWYSFFHRIPLLIAYERTAHTERKCPLWRKLYRRFIGLFVDGYIANGQLTKEYLVSQGVKLEKIFTGGMCADSNGLAIKVAEMPPVEKKTMRESIVGNDTEGLLYIYVGQIIPRKGVSQLLEAWECHHQKYPIDRLLLVGTGEQLTEFQEQYKNNKTITFTSNVDYSNIYKYYAISDVFIIPTLEDNWSLVVPEAMACGLPIACSIYNGCHPELVKKDENGITFDPLNRDSILHALAYFHNQDLIQMGNRSVAIEKEYNPEKTADNIINAIRTVCLNRKERLFQSHE